MRRGFTLIEIAIVLVIVGLIAGAVAIGRELIYEAELRSTVRQFRQFDAAAQTFRLKYNNLPGDLRDPASLGFDAASVGNGDGTVGECSTQTAQPCSLGGGSSSEYYHFWYHLAAANLIPHAFTVWTDPPPTLTVTTGGDRTPTTIISPRRRFTAGGSPGGWGIQADTIFHPSAGGDGMPNHAFLIAAVQAVGGNGTAQHGGYAPSTIFDIDRKIDDGMPFTGIARPWTGFDVNATHKIYTLNAAPGGPNVAVCVDSNENRYNNYSGTLPAGLCNLNIRSSF